MNLVVVKKCVFNPRQHPEKKIKTLSIPSNGHWLWQWISIIRWRFITHSSWSGNFEVIQKIGYFALRRIFASIVLSHWFFYLTFVRISLFTQRWSLMSERSLIQVLLLLQRVAAKSGTRSEGGECSIKIRLVSAHYLSQWRKGQRFLVCFFGDICRTFMYFGISSTCFCCWICWASWTKGSKKSFPSKNSWLTLISSHNGEKVR